jgi:transcriptional regulator with XRE-family HTH domain
MNVIGKKTGLRKARLSKDQPNLIDVHVGSRVRLRRNMLGLSQEKLGKELGLTFQQVQKYERGANRIGASRLHDLSRVLQVPLSFFYDDMDPVRAPAIPAGFAEPPAEAFDFDPLRRPETVELVSAYYKIEDTALRRRLFELARALAGGSELLSRFTPRTRMENGRSLAARSMSHSRAQDYQAKIASGDPASIAEVVHDLYRGVGQPVQSDQPEQQQPKSTRIASRRGRAPKSDDEKQIAAAFVAAAAGLLNAVDETLFEIRQGRKETNALLSRLEARLASSDG